MGKKSFEEGNQITVFLRYNSILHKTKKNMKKYTEKDIDSRLIMIAEELAPVKSMDKEYIDFINMILSIMEKSYNEGKNSVKGNQ
jgi:hypothetical protein